MRITLITAALLAALSTATMAAAAPKIQFDQTVYDFGKTSLVENVSGVFKYKNIGDAVLKLETPQPSCGCTVAGVKPDTLQPGESGELAFTLNLGNAKANMEKHITVKSNDPLTPAVSLTIRVDYTPLYDISPMTLAPKLAFGVKQDEQSVVITRTDGKPLQILRLETSKPWITAKAEPATGTNDATVRLRITVQRDGEPRRFNEYVHIFTVGEANLPASTIYLYGQVMGEISVSPEVLYWSVPATAQAPSDRPEAMAVRRLTIQSASGKPFELKNAQSSVPAIHVELVPKESGKSYELVATLAETPAQTVSGNVSFESSVAGQPKMEVPVIVNVFKP